MGEEEAPRAAPSPPNAWRAYISEELPRTVQESADSAIRSARSLQQSSSTHLRSLQVTFGHPPAPFLLFYFPAHYNNDVRFCRILFLKSELDIDIMKRLSSTKLKVPHSQPSAASNI